MRKLTQNRGVLRYRPPRFSFTLCVATPLLAVALPATAADKAPTTKIYGGEVAKACEFPTTLYAQGCTGTLIHPRVILSAGHCPTLSKIAFGESIRNLAKEVSIKWCEQTPFTSTDAQICVLEEAIEGLPVAPILQGCEIEALQANAKVILAGFGVDENDSATRPQTDEKRWVETQINRVSDIELYIGGGGKGGCQGDSGGPVYMKLDDGTWRTIGTTHGGDSHPDCDEGIYKRTDRLIQWYEEQLRIHGETTIDLTPCFNNIGEWEATRACGGYAKDVRGPYGDWSNHCGEGMPVQKYSATCGKAFDPNEEASTSTSGQPSQGSESTGGTQGASGEPNSSSSTAGAGESPTGNDDNAVPGDAATTESKTKTKASFSCNLQPSEPYGAFLTMLAVIMWAQSRRRS